MFLFSFKFPNEFNLHLSCLFVYAINGEIQEYVSQLKNEEKKYGSVSSKRRGNSLSSYFPPSNLLNS